MKAITTEYKGPTYTLAARVTARDGDGNRVTVGEPLRIENAGQEGWHRFAAMSLIEKMGWGWEPDKISTGWQQGAIYVHVYSG